MTYTQTILKILRKIQKCIDNSDHQGFSQERKRLEFHLEGFSGSAMTAYRLRKIAKINGSYLSENRIYLKKEIEKLIYLLTHLVSWHCKMCKTTIETETEHQLPLLINAHEISSEHQKNIKKV